MSINPKDVTVSWSHDKTIGVIEVNRQGRVWFDFDSMVLKRAMISMRTAYILEGIARRKDGELRKYTKVITCDKFVCRLWLPFSFFYSDVQVRRVRQLEIVMTFRDTVLEALDNEELLNDWEWDFIQSVADEDGGWVPTPKQQAVLESIQETMDA